MRTSLIISFVTVALAMATGRPARVAEAAHASSTTGRTTVYSDTRYHYTVAYPSAWSVQRHIPMYVRALKHLSRVGVGLESPDHNAWMLAVVGRGAYSPTRLRVLEHDALTQMVQTAPFGITYTSGTLNGVRYQIAHTYGSWYDDGNHIAIADQIVMAMSRGLYTYVFAVSVKLHTSSTSVESAQARSLIASLVVR